MVCPGSRCAPLLIGFGKHPSIETISVTDERSAGFIGLGLAQQSGKPVALVCTSGTAALNFAPAVTEAFYQHVPLIVLTADRPPEWIDQWDGQTIRQKHIYMDHVKGSFVCDEENVDLGEKALALVRNDAPGPVHLNIPIREPFYPETFSEISFAPKGTRLRSTTDGQAKNTESLFDKVDELVWGEFASLLNSSDKVMVLGGQMEPSDDLVDLLDQLDVPVIGDVISNLHGVDGVIKSADLLFKNGVTTKGLPALREQAGTKFTKSFQPDFLVTFGRSVISKNLKLFLRQYKPKVHWHIGLGMVGNPFQSLTRIVEVEPVAFFKKWVNELATKGLPALREQAGTESTKRNEYLDLFLVNQNELDEAFEQNLNDSEFNYFSAVRKVMNQLPKQSVLHLGNSMPVRIANLIGLDDPTVDVWCNRGTSGIDGILSTTVGHALANSSRKHILIIGDLSFFYDRNGLWLNHEFPSNLQIVILNDSGGGIFNMIPGPSSQGELTKLFTTPHHRTAELTAKEFGLDYRTAASLEEIDVWKAGILEIFTDMKTNTKVFKNF